MASWRAAAAGWLLVVTTQNVAHDLPRDGARHDIAQAAQGSSVVVTQEMGKRHAALLAPRGWGTAHAAGERRGDCATYWQRSRWQLVRSYVRQLTYAPFRAGHRWAQVTLYRDQIKPPKASKASLAVVCVHMITRGHRPAYRRGMTRLHQLLASLPQRHVVVGGDWNAPRWLGRPGWPGTTPARTGPRGGKDDGMAWRHGHLRHQRILHDTRSDHAGVRARLWMGTRAP